MSKCPDSTLSLAIRYLWQPFHHRIRRESQPPELSMLLQIHSLIVVSGSSHDSSLLTRLLLHCLSLPSFPSPYAFSIFNQIRLPDVSTYNAIIRALSLDPQNAVSVYTKMRREGVFPNQHTFPLLLKSKTLIPFHIFAQAIKFGFGSDRFVCNSLISAFANSGRIQSARQLFDEMPHRDAIAYTALMDGYIKNARAFHALELFLQMKSTSSIDEVAVVTALCAVAMSGHVWLGRWIHGFYIESGRVFRDVYINSALIDMYMKTGCCSDAAKIFDEMPYRNIVSWRAMLAGYMQSNRCNDALLLFRKMLVEKLEPNEAILATTLTACGHLGSMDQGRWIDKYITIRKLELNSVLGTALIDMYAKCGSIQDAFRVFNMMKVKDVYPWTALIFGQAMNGDGIGALRIFNEMVSSRVWPNEVTFIGVLCACCHGGLVNEGRELFESMEGVYGIKRTVDHYGCMVDLVGRAGLLEEAVKLIVDMPIEPSAGVWGALFNACMIYRNFELGRSVGNLLIRLQPGCSGRYVRLTNLYCKCRDWEAAASMRKKMNETGVEKNPGCSWIEVDGVLFEFVAFDTSVDVGEDVYGVLDRLTAEIRRLPFVVENDHVL